MRDGKIHGGVVANTDPASSRIGVYLDDNPRRVVYMPTEKVKLKGEEKMVKSDFDSNLTIDELVEMGVSPTQIYNELVLRTKEKEDKSKKIIEARNKVQTAILDYFSLLGIDVNEKETKASLMEAFMDAFRELEKGVKAEAPAKKKSSNKSKSAYYFNGKRYSNYSDFLDAALAYFN